jgi:hypothetical protein
MSVRSVQLCSALFLLLLPACGTTAGDPTADPPSRGVYGLTSRCCEPEEGCAVKPDPLVEVVIYERERGSAPDPDVRVPEPFTQVVGKGHPGPDGFYAVELPDGFYTVCAHTFGTVENGCTTVRVQGQAVRRDHGASGGHPGEVGPERSPLHGFWIDPATDPTGAPTF